MPGKTVAVFAGVHGNEKAGVIALQKITQSIQLKAGTVYFVLANPPAVRKNVRYISKNLNRCFFVGNKGDSWEDKRARQLMKLLDRCDAVLDLHGYNGPEDTPFVITEDPENALVKDLDFPVVITNWSRLGLGATDTYMVQHEKMGVCLECGSNLFPDKYVRLAEKSILLFLRHYGLITFSSRSRRREQTVFRVQRIVKRKTKSFSFDKEYKNFEKLATGKAFAIDGSVSYVAEEGTFILFPRPNQKVGQEAFILIEKIK